MECICGQTVLTQAEAIRAAYNYNSFLKCSPVHQLRLSIAEIIDILEDAIE